MVGRSELRDDFKEQADWRRETAEQHVDLPLRFGTMRPSPAGRVALFRPTPMLDLVRSAGYH